MTGTVKNKDLFPVGARVRPAYAKLSTRVGTVVEHTRDGERMVIRWDGDEFPAGDFMPMEVIEA